VAPSDDSTATLLDTGDESRVRYDVVKLLESGANESGANRGGQAMSTVDLGGSVLAGRVEGGAGPRISIAALDLAVLPRSSALPPTVCPALAVSETDQNRGRSTCYRCSPQP
jgi:hypothetical protein